MYITMLFDLNVLSIFVLNICFEWISYETPINLGPVVQSIVSLKVLYDFITKYTEIFC